MILSTETAAVLAAYRHGDREAESTPSQISRSRTLFREKRSNIKGKSFTDARPIIAKTDDNLIISMVNSDGQFLAGMRVTNCIFMRIVTTCPILNGSA